MKFSPGEKISLKFITEDGSVIMDRKSDPEWFFDRWSDEPTEFLKLTLGDDARRKGVQVIRIERRAKLEFVGIVRWLSKKVK